MIHPERPSNNTQLTDEHGTYTVYHRLCNYQGCGVELTSRNRFQSYLLCKPCAKAKDRARSFKKARTPQQIALAEERRVDPRRRKAHHLLEMFLNNPTNADIKQGLSSYLMDLEIAGFMRNL